jgi:hypothetical protein
VAAVSAGLPRPARVSPSAGRVASPATAAAPRVPTDRAVSGRAGAVSPLRPAAHAPHGPAAQDSAGSAAGAPAAAPSRLRLPFFAFDLPAPAAAVRPEGVALLLHIERPD